MIRLELLKTPSGSWERMTCRLRGYIPMWLGERLVA